MSKSTPREQANLGKGYFEINEVWQAAESYLEAAKVVSEMQEGRVGWLEVQEWYVVHHLAFISVELFLKSRTARGQVARPFGEDIPEFESFSTQKSSHNKPTLSNEREAALRAALTHNQLELLDQMNKGTLARGRYPYEGPKADGKGFPSGDLGRVEAYAWMDLADAISSAIKTGRF